MVVGGKIMQLSEYLKELSYEIVQGAVDVEVTGLVTDNRRITAGSLFVCIAGANFDGHSAAKEAAEKGAVALIVEKDVDTDQNVTVIKVDSTRRALAYLSAAHFGNESDRCDGHER